MIGRTSRQAILSENERELIKKLDQKRALKQERARLKMKSSRSQAEDKRIVEINKELTKLSKRFSKFSETLHERLLWLKKDMQIILKSKPLTSILLRDGNHIYSPVTEGLHEQYPILASLEELGGMQFRNFDGSSETIPDYNGWKIKSKVTKRKRYFWLSINEKPETGNKDTTLSTYPIIGIKGTYNISKKMFPKGTKKQIKIKESINIREILRKALEIEKDFQDSSVLPRTKTKAVDVLEIKNRVEDFQNN